MTDALTHERCSELLGDFAGGRLDVAEGARVEAHLESCPDCSAELRAVMALRVEDEPLTDMERARVRKGVGDRLGEGAAQRSRPERAPGRLAAALGVAALLAIGGVAVVSLGSGGDGDEAPETAAGAGGDGGGRSADRGRTAAGGANTEAQFANPSPGPSYDGDAGKLTPKRLDKIRRNATILSFSDAYSAKDAPLLRDEYVAELVQQAGPPVGDLIRSCAESVYSSQPYSVLPAYGARGRLRGRDALVLGFVWTDEQVGPLNQFMFWTWPTDSCEGADLLDYRAGRIGTRK